MKCCGFGGCSFSFIYILLTALLFFLKSFILSFGDLYYKYETNIFWIKPVLAKHGLMKLLIEYLGYIIYGGIFLHILRKKNIFTISNLIYSFILNYLIIIIYDI